MVSTVKSRKKIMIDNDKCTICCECINVCREEAIGLVAGKVKLIRENECELCEDCVDICEHKAITLEEVN